MLSSLFSLPLASGGSIFLAILGIGFLIFVHELGHYLACRLTRTRVETFSIGFGTRLFGWENVPGEPKRFTLGRRRLDPADHAMDFRVALVPLGGYVKMAGENLGDDRSGAPDEFPSKPLSSRVFIVSAGVIMNVITAFFLYLVAYGAHIEEEPAMIGSVTTGGPAWEAGLETGDRVLTLAGTRTRSFFELRRETVVQAPGRAITASVQRGDETFDMDVTPQKDEEAGAVLLKIRPPRILVVKEGERTLEVGPEDVVKVNGVAVRGGANVLRAMETALRTGQGAPQVALRPADADPLTLLWRDESPKADAPGQYRVGIERVGRLAVKAVRGRTAEHLQVGDQVVGARVGSETVPIETALGWAELPFRDSVTHVVVERGGTTVEVPVPTSSPTDLHRWIQDAHVDLPDALAVRPLATGTFTILPGGHLYRYPSVPSEAAGLKSGDVIVKFDGEEVSKYQEVIEAVLEVKDATPIQVEVRGSDGASRTLSIVPVKLQPLAGPDLGDAPYWEPYETESIFDAVGVAFARTGREVQGVFSLIGAFFTGRLNFQKNIGGPVTIVTASSAAVQRNWLHFLIFLAYISVTLAVLNILPIPVLDGGHLMFMLIEKVKGSPLKDATIGKLQFVGLLLLLVLMVFAFKNDFTLLFD